MTDKSERGGALLAVLWLSAILAAVAFSVANTVRGETERTSTQSEAVRTYYLATSAIERALMYIELGPGTRNPDGSVHFFEPNTSRLHFAWPEGVATVEIIPESSKFDLNATAAPDLLRLLTTVGMNPDAARETTAAILDWRNPAGSGGFSPFDGFYQSQHPSFRSRHASFEETEELLLVKGMTPDLFYGSYGRNGEGRLLPRPALRDCVSVCGSTGPFDINTVQPAVLAAIGFPPAVAASIEQRRRATPFRNEGEIAQLAPIVGPAFSRVTFGPGMASIYSLRATAQLRNPNGGLSDLTRSVAAMLKFHKPGVTPAVEILRWYDN